MLTKTQRNVLNKISDGEWHWIGPFETVSPYMATKLDANGWILRAKGGPSSGAPRCQITQAGLDALAVGDLTLSIKLGTARFAALAEALDQYCENQGEAEAHEDDDEPPSAKLAAAIEVRDQLNSLLQKLAE